VASTSASSGSAMTPRQPLNLQGITRFNFTTEDGYYNLTLTRPPTPPCITSVLFEAQFPNFTLTNVWRQQNTTVAFLDTYGTNGTYIINTGAAYAPPAVWRATVAWNTSVCPAPGPFMNGVPIASSGVSFLVTPPTSGNKLTLVANGMQWQFTVNYAARGFNGAFVFPVTLFGPYSCPPPVLSPSGPIFFSVVNYETRRYVSRSDGGCTTVVGSDQTGADVSRVAMSLLSFAPGDAVLPDPVSPATNAE
jgi:hypothetical protein